MSISLAGHWQFELVAYDDDATPYPLLLLEPAGNDEHRCLAAVLNRAGLEPLSPWEWRHGLWPLAAGCRILAAADGTALTVAAAGKQLRVGTGPLALSEDWVATTAERQQTLLVLLPPPAPGEAGTHVTDIPDLDELARRHQYLIGLATACTE